MNSTRRAHWWKAVVGVIVSVSGAPPLVTAQTAERSPVLEEVVVTATRREERLQDVPISVSAFSQEKLDAQGLRSIDDLTRLTPGIAFSRNGMTSSANYNDENSDINIRGVDSTAGTSTTGIYIDDTPIQGRRIGFGGVNAFPALFDLDRVEALRGPQGTLFGAGAEGGAVRFLAPLPDLHARSGYVRTEAAWTQRGDPSYEAGGAIGVPLIDNALGLRVSASFRRDGGWVDRASYTRNGATDPATPPLYTSTTDKASNWQQTATFRAALKWKVTDAVSITPSIYYQRLQINDTAAYWVDLSNPGASVYRNGNAGMNPSTDPFWLGAIKLDWDLGFAHLVSNTSYLSREQHSVSDYSQYLRAVYTLFGLLPSTFPPPGARGSAYFRDIQRNFYQEIRLASTDGAARVGWNTGLYFSHANENVPEDIVDPTLDAESGGFVCSPEQPCPNGLIFHAPTQRVVDKQLAAFGEVNIKLTDTVKATLGLRVSKIDYTGSNYITGPFQANTFTSESSGSENPVTPKAVLSWQPDRDHLVYASAAKGFRPGGINVGVGDICQQDLRDLGLPLVPGSTSDQRQTPAGFSSDSLWSYEIGDKSTFLDHRLQVNSSLFYIDWRDIQQSVFLPSCGVNINFNLGKVRSLGGDVALIYHPISALTLDLSVAYTDAKFTKSSCTGTLTFDGGACSGTDPTSGLPVSVSPIVSKGDRLLAAPWTFTAAVEYHFGAMGGRKPYARIDYQRAEAQKGLVSNVNPANALADPTLSTLPVTTNLALRGGFRFSGFDVSVFAQNLTNAHPVLIKSRDINLDSVTVLYFEHGVRPRTIGVTATYRY